MFTDPELELSAAAIRRQAGEKPFDLAIVLGSGLGAVAERASAIAEIAYSELPCFPPATVPGHAGRLLAGELQGWRVLLFQGRFHLYEGYTARQVAILVRLAHRLGASRLLLTNAAGGICADFSPGDFMFIADHLNLMGDNPLQGERGNPFTDLSRVYRSDLFPPLAKFAAGAGISLHQGVLGALPGPSYETPAEIRMLRLLGADAISMSTIPEAIMARYLGMEVAGLSFIANPAAGLATALLSHSEVLAAGSGGAVALADLAEALIGFWQAQPCAL